jgi:dienelactone hydrolase
MVQSVSNPAGPSGYQGLPLLPRHAADRLEAALKSAGTNHTLEIASGVQHGSAANREGKVAKAHS